MLSFTASGMSFSPTHSGSMVWYYVKIIALWNNIILLIKDSALVCFEIIVLFKHVGQVCICI